MVGQVRSGTRLKLFDFGSNWEAFSEQRIDDRRLDSAVRSLSTLLERDNLKGLSFLDVGCGSGLFSIAAYKLNAARIVGIDINPHCIAVSERNRDNLAPGAPITFRSGSALSSETLDGFGQFDLVYAWGSLHHTGAMWDAIRNVTRRVSPGGTLVLAIYNKHITSPVWRMIKWLYNQLPEFAQKLMVVFFAGIIYVAKFLVTRRNPLDKERGMDFWFDVVDWVGGYPYEYATPEEVKRFVCSKGFELRRYIAAQVPTGCNEFLFLKQVE
jgi:2-polyprenyl-6-hydroxyphenyl methylase/3-demethylubiquinone-9 3-methyltransferase